LKYPVYKSLCISLYKREKMLFSLLFKEGLRENLRGAALAATDSLICPLLGAQELDSDEPGLCVHLSKEDCG
jgi:hypothetical protein